MNGTIGESKSADVVGVTENGRYYVYEAGGTGITDDKLMQLKNTSDMLGPENVLRQTYVLDDQLKTMGLTVSDDGLLMEGDSPKLVNGKPIYVIFTHQ